MAELKNMLFGALLFVALIAGMYNGINSWYSRNGVSQNLDSSAFNITGTNNYLENWANQTSTAISNAQAVPILGSSYMLLTGVFQAITLLVSIPNMVILPLFNAISGVLGLPLWFISFVFVAILLYAMIELLNVMKGGKI